MISELFPITDYTKLQYDNEGLYSITNYTEADQISNIIVNMFTDIKNLCILDGTGGIGGNTISFSKYFSKVTSIELNKERFIMLKNNISNYNITNIKLFNVDSVEYVFNNYNKYNIYFFDPPWGGPDYKKYKNLTLKMGNKTLLEIVKFLKEKSTDKLIIFKLPFNYNFNEFYQYDYKLYKIKKYYIIII
uniref:Trimethylguanosine synthase n=1 Tax=viral metagenome TaxID=1070528 RepID=A0A6C0DCL1_9ZZZZ